MASSTNAIEQTPAPSREEPETPAPVFAMRAFKHALFGTPAPPPQPSTAASRPELAQRHSTNSTHPDPKPLAPEKARKPPNPRHSLPEMASRPERPPRRVQGSNREQGLQAEGRDAFMDASPAKRPGILLTPGTGGNRRKTVSFLGGESTEQERALAVAERERVENVGDQKKPESMGNPGLLRPRRVQRGAGSFAERLKGTGDAAANKNEDRQGEDGKTTNDNIEDITIDMSAPRSTSGRYWKSEFESYSSRSELEMRKLQKKEQVAKKYAKDCDQNAVNLEEQLQREQEKIARLEQDVQAYITRLGKAVEGQNSSQNTKATSQRSSNEVEDINNRKELESLRKNNVKLRRLAEERDLEIERLRRENEQLRRTASRPTQPSSIFDRRKRTSTSGLEEQHQHQNSDIWADAATTKTTSATQKKPGSSKSTRGRSPLAPRTNEAKPSPTGADVGAPGTDDLGRRAKTSTKRTDSKRTTLTEERREAARKRLEERRKNREKSE